jgi:hypothetical protein
MKKRAWVSGIFVALLLCGGAVLGGGGQGGVRSR